MSNRRRLLLGLTATAAVAGKARAATPIGATSIYSVVEFGAGQNAREFDTPMLQAAIDACAAGGGGTVYFPAGNYYSGGLIMKSGVHLYIEAGATLHGSENLDDFPKTIPEIRSYTDNYTERSLIYGEGLTNIGIHGDGVIDGHGKAYEGPYKVRPYMIRIISSRDVSVTGVTIRNSPMWVQHYLACDDIYIHGITVHSRVNHNNDGIDIDGCHRVTISDCNISSGDDAIVLKSTLNRSTKNVAVTNCVLSSYCNAFKLGTESNGGFEDIVLSNCTMYDTRLSGFAVECVDGGVLDGVHVSNVTMRAVKNPIFVRLGNRARPFREGKPVEGVGKLRNVRISGVKATGASTIGCAISGIPGHPIENLSIEGVRIVSEGGVTDPPFEVEEAVAEYPEHKMFGILPAHGFFIRHARNVRFRETEVTTTKPDPRPAVVCEDIEELALDGCAFEGSSPLIRLQATTGVMISGCRLRREAETFLDATGGVEELTLFGNDLSKARQSVAGGGRPRG